MVKSCSYFIQCLMYCNTCDFTCLWLQLMHNLYMFFKRTWSFIFLQKDGAQIKKNITSLTVKHHPSYWHIMESIKSVEGGSNIN